MQNSTVYVLRYDVVFIANSRLVWRFGDISRNTQVFYLEDVFASGQRELNAELCESLLGRLVRPMLLGDWLSGRSGAMFPQV